MDTIDFFKQQAKNFLKDFKTKSYNQDEEIYVYSPRYFADIDDIVLNFDIDEETENFSLMKAQHIIARLAGFDKWTEMIKASPARLELGKLLLTNRIPYQEEIGIFSSDESLIVTDWKDFEKKYLSGCSDENKLEVFKTRFLSNDMHEYLNTITISLDFTDDEIAQDMICTIMKDKKMKVEQAIKSCVTDENLLSVIKTGWASIAVSLWGHAESNKLFKKLDEPLIKVVLDSNEKAKLDAMIGKEIHSYEEAVLQLMIFDLESLGYHI